MYAGEQDITQNGLPQKGIAKPPTSLFMESGPSLRYTSLAGLLKDEILAHV